MNKSNTSNPSNPLNEMGEIAHTMIDAFCTISTPFIDQVQKTAKNFEQSHFQTSMNKTNSSENTQILYKQLTDSYDKYIIGVPGVDKNGISTNVNGNILEIKAKTSLSFEESSYTDIEYSKKILLPPNRQNDNIRIKCLNGCLIITIDKVKSNIVIE